ncbi:hypothetical protein RCL_jg27595.t1 [Rhizophagus clarus]|nr:hypothetical protein RCL_jg27595.t1 [Rhizophagus clarus]
MIVEQTEEPIDPSSRDINNQNQIVMKQSAPNQKSRAKKIKLKPITNTLLPDKGKINSQQPPKSTDTTTAENQTNTPDLMEDVVSITPAVDLYPAEKKEDCPMDIDLIGVNAPSNISEILDKPDNYRKNPYILELQTLPNDTFMVNSPFNDDNNHKGNLCNSEMTTIQLKKDDTNMNMDRLMSTDEVIQAPTPPINNDIISQFFTLKHSFLPNSQRVAEETQRNEYELTLTSNGSWRTTKKIKNPKATLENLKNKSLADSSKESIYAVKTDDSRYLMMLTSNWQT